MAYRALIAAIFLFASGLANAGYAQLEPPKGWGGPWGSGSVGTLRYGREAANVGQWVNRTVITDASLSVGGRAVKIPAALRFASNAGRFASSRIFMNPWLAGGVMVGGWLAEALIRWNPELEQWEVPDGEGEYIESDGYWWRVGTVGPLTRTKEDACRLYIDLLNPALEGPDYKNVYKSIEYVSPVWKCKFTLKYLPDPFWDQERTGDLVRKEPSDCPAGWIVTPAGCLQEQPYRKIVQPEFDETLTGNPMPDQLPNETPDDWPWPVELPKINPGPAPDYTPRPAFIPTGDPVPNPNYDPDAEPSPENQPYIRPGIHLKPANKPESPWNVDLTPVDRPSADDASNPEPDLGGNPESPGDKPKSPDQVGLCDQYPDILACEKLRPPESDEIESKEVDFDFQPESGFNGAGVCPQPISVTLDGRTYSFKWDGLCNALELLKPLMLAFAWVFAAFILLG